MALAKAFTDVPITGKSQHEQRRRQGERWRSIDAGRTCAARLSSGEQRVSRRGWSLSAKPGAAACGVLLTRCTADARRHRREREASRVNWPVGLQGAIER